MVAYAWELGQGLWQIQHNVRKQSARKIIQKVNQDWPCNKGQHCLILDHILY